MSTPGLGDPSNTATPTSESWVTASPLQASDGNSGGSSSTSTTSSSLYLFTFLATLLMLLLVSFGIVLRSFIMRRQLRRRLEEDIAHGYVPPSQLGWGAHRHLGKKPKVWDRWISASSEAHWDDMKPLSAMLISNSQVAPHERPETDTAIQSTLTPSPEPSTTNFVIDRFNRTRRRRNDHVRSLPQASSTPHPPSPPSLDKTAEEQAEVEVSVLVAMPAVHHNHSPKGKERADEDEFPDVVLGIASIPFPYTIGSNKE